MAEEVQLKFGAQTAELTHAIEGVKEQLEGLKGFAEGMTEQLKELFAIREIVEFIKSMAELGEQTERTALMLGITVESVGQLSGVAALTGGNMEALAMTMERMSLNVQRSSRDAFNPTAQALKVIGLNAKDLIGLPADKYFEKLAEAVGKFNPSLNLTNALMVIGGRGVAQMIPTLIEGKEAWEKFQKAIKDTGSVLSEATVKGMVETQHNLVLLGKSFQGLGATIFTGFQPAIDGVVKAFTDLVQWFRRSIEEGGALKGVFDALTTTAKGLAASLQSVVSLFQALVAVASFKIGLGANFQEEAAKLKKSLEDIATTWKSSMGAIFGGEEGHAGEAHKGEVERMRQDLREQLRARMEELQERIKIADDAYKATAERLNSEVKVFKITETEKTAGLLAALNERDIQEQYYLQKQLALWKENTPEYQKVLNEMTNTHGKFVDDVQKLNEQLLQSNVKQWESALTPIQSAFDSQLRGLLAHTTTWSQAMKSIVGDLVIDMIKALESFVVKKAALALGELFAPDPLALANAVKGITANLGQVFAGFTAFYAPLFGPDAPGMAAEATAGVGATAVAMSGIGSAEGGAWEIPATSPWLLHKGETVLPSRAADAFRSMATSSGIGGATANFTVIGMDGADIVRTLNRHAGTFARVLQGHMNANPNTHR